MLFAEIISSLSKTSGYALADDEDPSSAGRGSESFQSNVTVKRLLALVGSLLTRRISLAECMSFMPPSGIRSPSKWVGGNARLVGNAIQKNSWWKNEAHC